MRKFIDSLICLNEVYCKRVIGILIKIRIEQSLFSSSYLNGVQCVSVGSLAIDRLQLVVGTGDNQQAYSSDMSFNKAVVTACA